MTKVGFDYRAGGTDIAHARFDTPQTRLLKIDVPERPQGPYPPQRCMMLNRDES